jgi:hypothetical protein
MPEAQDRPDDQADGRPIRSAKSVVQPPPQPDHDDDFDGDRRDSRNPFGGNGHWVTIVLGRHLRQAGPTYWSMWSLLHRATEAQRYRATRTVSVAQKS